MSQVRARVYAFWPPGTPLSLVRGPVVGMPPNTYYQVSVGDLAEAVILPYAKPEVYGHPVELDVELFDEPRVVTETESEALRGDW